MGRRLHNGVNVAAARRRGLEEQLLKAQKVKATLSKLCTKHAKEMDALRAQFQERVDVGLQQLYDSGYEKGSVPILRMGRLLRVHQARWVMT